MRSWPRVVVHGASAFAVVLLLATLPAFGDARDQRDQRIATLDKTVEIVDEKRTERQADLRQTVTRVYRLLRPRRGLRWTQPDSVRARTWRRAWLGKVLAIKKVELAALVEELELVRRNRLFETRPVARHQLSRLIRPVAGRLTREFGAYRHRSGARLVRRGIELATRPGEPVRAPMAGIVDYVGEVRGLGATVLL
ncbi:MAG: hypothetical protein KJO07_14450, partial [Deltaproteobacteria bacterium]|nr:hypothetical protein [Deltaproteobacteria bacterium]